MRKLWMLAILMIGVLLGIGISAVWEKATPYFLAYYFYQNNQPDGYWQSVNLRQTMTIAAPYMRISGDRQLPLNPNPQHLEIFPGNGQQSLRMRFHFLTPDGNYLACDYEFEGVVCVGDKKPGLVFEIQDTQTQIARSDFY